MSRRAVAAGAVTTALLDLAAGLGSSTGGAAQAAVPTVVTATVSDNRVVVGHEVTISGTVTPPGLEPRTVVLQLETATGWEKVRKTTASAVGSYTMKVPTDWYDRHVLRVVAPAAGSAPEGMSERQVVKVVPAYDPRGKKSQWNRFNPLARWDPCRPLTYRTNLKAAPKGAAKLVKQAFRKIHAATGFDFVRLGSTTKVPFSSGPDSSQHLDYGLVIAWSTPRRVPGLGGSTAGLGGSTAQRVGDDPWRYVYGGAVFDATLSLPVKGFGRGKSTGALLLHEIAHALGLDHVQARTQIMYPSQQSRFRGRYEAGDLNGLHKVGAAQGCFL